MHRLLLLCCVLGLTSQVLGCRGQAARKPVEDATVTQVSSTTTVVPTPPRVTTPSPFANTTPSDGPQTNPPRAAAPAGSFRGSWMTSRRGRRFQAYRGIKYAEPPVGELRFQPPKPILEYKGEVDASQDGPACPLPADILYPMDEDCLTINVYTPDNNNSSKPLPVIFFIHPGGFYSMTGRSDLAGPHYLLDRDVVLVTINYRLGSLGFLSTGDALAPGNNGFKDQVVALKWVQRNIRAFGGDPNLVTITGCSAGSISVLLHMISPMSKGLFHRGVSMSGSPTGKEPLPEHMYELAVKQARILNCPTNSSEAIISCLKTKSWREMGDSLTGFFDEGFDAVGVWRPVVERDFGQERFLAIDPMDAIRQRKMQFVPHMISQTTNEFFWKAFSITENATLLKRMNEDWEVVAPLAFDLPARTSSEAAKRLKATFLRGMPLADDDISNKRLGQLYGDAIVGFNVHRMANLMCRHSSHVVYYYEFAYIGNHSYYEDPTTNKPIAAAHHDDLIYLFSQSYRFPTIGLGDGLDSQLVDRMTALWYNFAKTGDPNPSGSEQPELAAVNWPAMKPDNASYLRIGDEFSVGSRMFENRFEVWEDIYPIQY